MGHRFDPRIVALRLLVASAVAGGPLALAAPALAAPRWGITISHRNPYGQRCSLDEEALKTLEAHLAEELTKLGRTEPRGAACGLDPFTGSGTSFDRQSGANLYEVTVRNAAEGSAAEDTVPEGATVTVADELPEGLSLAGPPGPSGSVAYGSGWSCRVEDVETQASERPPQAEYRPRAVTCTKIAVAGSPVKLEPGGSYPPILLPVWVEANAPSSVIDEATVYGGGASPEAATTKPEEGTTEIAPAVPFGIFCFTLEDLKETPPGHAECEAGNGEPELQAGGHPVAISTHMVFDFTTNFLGQLVGAGGGADEFGVGPKEVEAELPPGLIGDPQNAGQCPLAVLLAQSECPLEDAIGYIRFDYTTGEFKTGEGGEQGLPRFGTTSTSAVYNVAPPPGHPAAFGFVIPVSGRPIILYPKLRSDGDYGFTVGTEAAGPLRSAEVTFCGYGATGELNRTTKGLENPECLNASSPEAAPFLRNPTACPQAQPPALAEAPLATLQIAPYPGSEAGGGQARMTTYFNGPSASPAEAGGPNGDETAGAPPASPFLTGCSKLTFKPSLAFEPSAASEGGTDRAGAPTGITLHLALPQSNAAQTPATPDLKDLTLSLPEGVLISPAGAHGLQACSEAQFGLGATSEPAAEAHCPLASQIGTVAVVSPDLPPEPGGKGQLQGALYAGQPGCSPCGEADAADGTLFRLFLQLTDHKAGLVVKLHGTTRTNPATGSLTTTFEDQPQLPFEALTLHLKGGPTAVVSNPQSCATHEEALGELTPWSAPGAEREEQEREGTHASHAAATSWPYAVECPASVPFTPSFAAGTSYPAAGRYSAFALTVTRGEGDQQSLQGLSVHMPPGLLAKVAGVPLCEEAQANAGSCSPESQIGTVTVAVGPGPRPYVEQGRVYLTGPYTSACTGASGPFGLSIVVPTVAGPFALAGEEGPFGPQGGRCRGRQSAQAQQVSRAAVEIDEHTAAVSVIADPLPRILDGVPVGIAELHIDIASRPDFERNPTRCAPLREGVTAALTATQGASATASSPFDVGGCGALAFRPAFTLLTQARTSRRDGASLTVRVTQGAGEADIGGTDLQLPAALPSRLATLHHACTEAQLAAAARGADCPAASFVGEATVHTPLLDVPLRGPAILVSHGGAAFPDIDFLLEGEHVRIDLVGHTDVRRGITYARFEAVPDAPIEAFEAVLPEGPHSILAANGDLCKQTLTAPTTITAQDGAQLTQQTRIAVTGCPKRLTRAQKLRRALRACRRKHYGQPERRRCERRARRRYGPARRAGRALRIQRARTVAVSRTGRAAGLAPPPGPGPVGVSGAARVFAAARAPGSAATAAAAVQPCAQENAPLHEPEEQVRRESSSADEATGAPYSLALPECRAYEMVSPVELQGHAVTELTAVSPSGDAVGFTSEGAFAEPANFYLLGAVVRNSYVAHRSVSAAGVPEWATSSAFAPAGLIELPNLGTPLASDFTPDLESAQLGCGVAPSGGYACALRRPGGPWLATPTYWPRQGLGTIQLSVEADLGESADLSRVFIEPGFPLQLGSSAGPQDHIPTGGLYEVSGLGGASPQLRLVNVDDENRELGLPLNGSETPLLGDSAERSKGTAYHAVSESGNVVFFTAAPARGRQTVYARVNAQETIALSAPAGCEPGEARCEPAAARVATFQGASADGSKAFFTTEQALLPTDRDATTDLYEYDLGEPPGRRLTLLSRGGAGDATPGEGALVQGVVQVSSDGSHVYFVAEGVLTTVPNTAGQVPRRGADNLYVIDTVTGQVSFIGTLAPRDRALWGRGCSEAIACDAAGERRAQATPDGRYLVFDSYAQLQPEDTNGCHGVLEGGVPVCSAQAVYRYDAASGELTWISRPAPGFASVDEGRDALVEALNGSRDGALADFADTGRAISEDGSYIVFTTAERLQANDLAAAPQVYLWHCPSPCADPRAGGAVSMVSAGSGEAGSAAISASGQDVFFTTATALVPQAASGIEALYDARVDGGIPPARVATCAGEGCQGEPPAPPAFATPGSALFSGGVNPGPPAVASAPPAKPPRAVRPRHRRRRRPRRPGRKRPHTGKRHKKRRLP